MRNKQEAREQAAVFDWARWQYHKYPELQSMYHIPNGGSRNAIEAANLKRQGVKAGVSDICLAVPRGGYGACYIEMKSKKGRTINSQKKWFEICDMVGNYHCICRSANEAIEIIKKYLNGEIVRRE